MCLKVQTCQLQAVIFFDDKIWLVFFFYNTLTQLLNFKGFMKLLSRAENKTQYLT